MSVGHDSSKELAAVIIIMRIIRITMDCTVPKAVEDRLLPDSLPAYQAPMMRLAATTAEPEGEVTQPDKRRDHQPHPADAGVHDTLAIVKERALVDRVKKALARCHGCRLLITSARSRLFTEYGRYAVVTRQNAIVDKHVSLEVLARELGVLEPGECVAS